MEVFTSLTDLQSYIKEQKRKGLSIGLVPTMGALHKGHRSLIERSRQENDQTICSIYVNPTQFNNSSDLQLYPRTLESDTRLLAETGCNAVFVPDNMTMYASQPTLRLNFGHLESVMEGQFRPGHFNGVGLVVSKLFHMVKPDKAYFGQKDLQQFLIIRQLVADLSFPLELVCCPIVREPDGLAMSSRNTRLTDSQRKTALALYQALLKAQNLLRTTSVAETKRTIHADFEALPDIRLEYFEVVNGNDLSEITELDRAIPVALCIAAFLGEVRLIDNALIHPDSSNLAK
jgi:pantoate--beta-alanine ligase